MKSRNPVIEFDDVQIYFADPYVIDIEGAQGTITVTQPKLGDMIKIGQARFFSSINTLITNTTSYRLPLWEIGLDWNNFSDFSLFAMLYRTVDKEVSELIFDGLDITQFELYEKDIEDKQEIILYNKEHDIEINEMVYFHISQYLRTAFNIQPEEKFTNDKTMKEWFITKDKRQLEIDRDKAKKDGEKKTSILPLISTCVNHAGFKYNIEEMRNLTVAQFYDSVKRLQIYENCTAVLKGMFSGFVDSSKIKAEAYNFMRES